MQAGFRLAAGCGPRAGSPWPSTRRGGMVTGATRLGTGRGNGLIPRLPRPPWRRPSPSPQRTIRNLHRSGPKGPASARPAMAGASRPPGPGAGLCHCVPNRLGLIRHARAGARQCLALSRPTVGCVFTRTSPRPPWRRPSPSPPCTIGNPNRPGLKGPASARPAPGGRFSPARSGRRPLVSRAASSPVEPSRTGGGEAAPRLLPPGQGRAVCGKRRVRVHTHLPAPAMAKAIAFATLHHRQP